MNKTISTTLALVVIVVAAVTVGVFTVQNLNSDNDVVANPVELNISESVVADESDAIDTSDWSEYENDGFGVRITNPGAWRLVRILEPQSDCEDCEISLELEPNEYTTFFFTTFGRGLMCAVDKQIKYVTELGSDGHLIVIDIATEDFDVSICPIGVLDKTYIATSGRHRGESWGLWAIVDIEQEAQAIEQFETILSTFEFIESAESSKAAANGRIALTPENEIDDAFCYGEEFNWDTPDELVLYENLWLGFRLDVPYNASWGNERFYLEPFDEISDGRDGWVQFGIFSRGCSVSSREYTLRPVEYRSVEDINMDRQGYAIKEKLPLVPFSVGTSEAVAYTVLGLCEHPRIEIQGIGIAANGITNNPNYLLTGVCFRMEDLKEIAATFEFIE